MEESSSVGCGDAVKRHRHIHSGGKYPKGWKVFDPVRRTMNYSEGDINGLQFGAGSITEEQNLLTIQFVFLSAPADTNAEDLGRRTGERISNWDFPLPKELKILRDEF